MPDKPTVKKVTQAVTTVRHVVGTYGRDRSNPPSLGHLREFVSACLELADDTPVRIDKGSLDEGGRFTITFSASVTEVLDA